MTEIDYTHSDLEPEEIAARQRKQAEEKHARKYPEPCKHRRKFAHHMWVQDMKERNAPLIEMD